jgi:hypothetical protein
MYVSSSFGTGKKEEKHANDLLKRFQGEEQANPLTEEQKDEEKLEVQAYEAILADANEGNDLT